MKYLGSFAPSHMNTALLRLVVSVLPLVMALSLAAIAPSVRAAVPKSCQGEVEAAAYKTGFTQGWTLLESSFEALGRDCRRLDELRKLADTWAKKSPEKGSQSLVCRSLGLGEGLQAALADFLKGCPK